jgi:hypothetical protein
MCIFCGLNYCSCNNSNIVYPQEFLLGMIDGKQFIIESQSKEIEGLKKALAIKEKTADESIKFSVNLLEDYFRLSDKVRKQDMQIEAQRQNVKYFRTRSEELQEQLEKNKRTAESIINSNRICQKTNQGRSEGVTIKFENATVNISQLSKLGYKPIEMVDEEPKEEVRPNSIPKTKVFMEAEGFKMDKSGCWRK